MSRRHHSLVFLVLPQVVLFCAIFVYPTCSTVVLAFYDVDNFGFRDATFVGLGNFQALLTTPIFVGALWNILTIWFAGGLVVFGLSFLFIALLRILPKGPRVFFRAAIFLPNIINVVAIVTIWTQYVYNPRGGLLATIFSSLGLDSLARVQWLQPDLVFWSMSVAYVWAALGWYAVILMAAEEKIPTEIYEAAELDGAGPMQVFFRITLPMIHDVLRVTVVMWTITTINLFAFVKAFNPIATSPETYTPALYLYELAFGAAISSGAQQVGKSAAAAVLLLLLVMIGSALIEWVMRRERLEY